MEIKVQQVTAIINSVSFVKEYETKFGILYQHKICYNDKVGYYSSKKKEGIEFEQGKEFSFIEEEKQGTNGNYFIVKLMPKSGQSNYVRQVKKEQSRYSGFAVSYVKDLIVAGKIDIKDWQSASEKIFKFMVNLDKTLE